MKTYKQLTSEQRYVIYVGLQNGKSQRAIAKSIDVHFSTVSREVRRNKGKRGYSWRLAHEMARERKERFPGNRSIPGRVRDMVLERLGKEWGRFK